MNVEDDSSNLNNNFNLVPTTCNCTLCAFSIHRRSTRMSAFTPAVQAFENQKFLASSHARNIRILCEHEETKHRLEVSGVKATVLIFGSARAKSSEQYSQMLGSLQESLVKCETDGDLVGAREFELSIERLKAGEWMCAYFDKVFELAREIAKWSTSFQAADDSRSCGLLTLKSPSMENLMATAELKDTQTSRPHPTTENKSRGLKAESLVICTGGGPGFMEAANKGAASVPGARSMGMGITLPFEDGLNPFVTEELAFQFHYFFTRKFWMVYHCLALIAAPGGVGTFDELFEVLTLKQTGKIQKDLPVVLFGKEFWTTVVNWEALVRFGTISRKDYADLFFTDDVQEALEYVTSRLVLSLPHVVT